MLTTSDRKAKAECYKYLAFSAIMLDMINSAKENFKEMLTQYPDMAIDTIQVPPSITIVFKQVVTEKELEAKKADEGKAGRRSRIVSAEVAGGAGFVAAGLGILFYTRESNAWDHYNQSTNPAEITNYRNETSGNFLVSRISLAVSATAFLYAGYQLWLLPPKESNKP